MLETQIFIKYSEAIAKELITNKRFTDQIYLIPGPILHAPFNLLIINLDDIESYPSITTIEKELADQADIKCTKLYEECLAPIKRKFSWFKNYLPKKHILIELERLALKYQISTTLYTYLERGDFLYFDYCWVFDYRDRMQAAQNHKRCDNVPGESLYIAETIYMGAENTTFAIRDDRQGTLEDAKLSVFGYLKCHLGVNLRSRFHLPDTLDWSNYKLKIE